jgi:hypothetical protein
MRAPRGVSDTPISDRTFKRGFWVMRRQTCTSCAISPSWHNWHKWAPHRGITDTTGLKGVVGQSNSCMHTYSTGNARQLPAHTTKGHP